MVVRASHQSRALMSVNMFATRMPRSGDVCDSLYAHATQCGIPHLAKSITL